MCETHKMKWKEYHGYLISDKGIVLNRFGREIKGTVSTIRGHKFICVCFRWDKKPHLRHLNNLVYRLFKDDYVKGARVYHIDGNIRNCAVENLKISRAYTALPTAEQLVEYEKNIMPCLKDFFSKQKWFNLEKCGMDIDNVLSESYLLCYKYLATYKPGTSFYKWCSERARWVFRDYYRKFIKEQAIVNEIKKDSEIACKD